MTTTRQPRPTRVRPVLPPVLLRLLVVAALVTGSTLVALVTAPSAAAAPAGCVTKREFKRVDVGDPKRTVHEVFGTRGRLGDGGAGGFDRLYPQCTPARSAAAGSADAAAAAGCEVQVEYVVGRGGVARVEAKKYNGVCEGIDA